MFLSILVIIVIAAGLLILLFSLKDKHKSGWLQFLSKGKEAGFSFREIEILHKLAANAKIEEPAAIFLSPKYLDLCIKAFVRTLHLSGATDEKGNQDFLSKLYDYRQKIEMEKPGLKAGISNSRQISDGQNLRVLVEGMGVFRSQIVKNTQQYLTISRPTNNKLFTSFSWQGQKLSIYFWREEDAGYVFDSDVIDEVFSKGISSLKVTHSNSLFRTQKRKSVRVKIHKAAFLYSVANEDDADRIEVNPGVKCFLEDLSDAGCAITVGGKAHVGMRIKAQFVLGNDPICMSGTVRSMEYNEGLNRSLMRVEADPLPIEIRNVIMGEVFGMLPENEEDLPFRMLREEVDAMNPSFSGDDHGILEEEPDNTESNY